jgi:hypothetical protein
MTLFIFANGSDFRICSGGFFYSASPSEVCKKRKRETVNGQSETLRLLQENKKTSFASLKVQGQ